jgi:Ca-activated chloride channel family protein
MSHPLPHILKLFWIVIQYLEEVVMKRTFSLAALLMVLFLSKPDSWAIGIGRLYARYPNWEDSPIFNLRIKTLHVDVTIRDQMAVTHVDQEFANDNYARLEGFYVFELPEGANVNEMALWIGGVRVPYVIKRAEDAVVIYQEIVRRTADPAILEQLGKNTFKLRIFPIDSYSSRRIEIQYSQLLQYTTGKISYLFPLDMTDYTSSPIEQASISIDLLSQFPITSVETSVDKYPTATVVTKLSDRHYTIVYGVENVAFAKDYSLYYRIDRQGFQMWALTYAAPDSLREDRYYILWTTLPDTLPGGTVQARELTFVADVSSSMDGVRLTQLKDALDSFLNLLTEEDKFNIITFATNVVQFRPDLVYATPAMKEQARAFVDQLVAIGLTDIETALKASVQQTYTDNIGSAIIFLTDGEPTWGETNSNSIVTRSRLRNTMGVRIFPVAVGAEVSLPLLQEIADQNGGILTTVSSNDSIALAVDGLFRRLFIPALADPTIDYGLLPAYDLYPTSLPTIFSGEQGIQTGRYLAPGGVFNVTLTGTIRGAGYQIQNQVAFPDTNHSMLAIARYWGAQKIQYLLKLIKEVGEVGELIDQVVALSIRYSVLTPYTAFLVVEPGNGLVISVHDKNAVPIQFELLQNYPNPFNPSTTIQYTIGGLANGPPVSVRLVVYNILGQKVKTLVETPQQPGSYRVTWDGTNNEGKQVPSGVYICRLMAGNFVSAKTMVLVK